MRLWMGIYVIGRVGSDACLCERSEQSLNCWVADLGAKCAAFVLCVPRMDGPPDNRSKT